MENNVSKPWIYCKKSDNHNLIEIFSFIICNATYLFIKDSTLINKCFAIYDGFNELEKNNKWITPCKATDICQVRCRKGGPRCRLLKVKKGLFQTHYSTQGRTKDRG